MDILTSKIVKIKPWSECMDSLARETRNCYVYEYWSHLSTVDAKLILLILFSNYLIIL